MNLLMKVYNMNREDIIEIVGSVVLLSTMFVGLYFALWIFR